LTVDKEQLRIWKEDNGFAGFLIDPDNGSPAFEARAAKTLSDFGHPDLLNDIRLLAEGARHAENSTPAENALLTATPLIFIDRSEEFNAFSTRLDGQNALVINKELLKEVAPEELNGLLGHELAHIVLGHTRRIGEPVSLFSKILNSRAAKVLLPVIPLLQRWKSRREEEQADKMGVVIAGDAEGFIEFFKQEEGAPDLFTRVMDRLHTPFSTHPRDGRRVKYLERFAVKHAEEIQAGKSVLDNLRGKTGEDFAQAAPRSAQKKLSGPLRPAAPPVSP